jgi:uroporphyrinogen III methyltransferase/synthase
MIHLAESQKPAGSSMKRQPDVGKVYLVGAGPGDSRLITLRGVECLRQADLVICDYLVNPRLLEHAPNSAERVRLGTHESGEAIDRRMVDEARRGKTVVRLKSGDPAVFGRLAEEVASLRTAAIPLEIVPGVTSGLAAAAFAEIPVTQGQQASAVAFITGHERKDKTGSGLDYAAIARFPGTLVLYMGVSTAAHWSAALIQEGKPPDTPVAIVRRCSWPDQDVVRCTLEDVAQWVASRNIRPPAIIIVGVVVDLAPETSWFFTEPLSLLKEPV